jgi:TRAP-type C4-dicarboxylate transport system substrate-binding protein
MEKYARAIQDVQKDMGIKTTSFPHLGIYGDVFVLNNKNHERVVFEDHSALKKKQDAYEKWQAQNSKEIQEHIQKPNREEGEEIVTFSDDVYPHKIIEPEEDEIVPHMCEPDEEAGEELIVMTDDIPFLDNKKNTKKTSLEYS